MNVPPDLTDNQLKEWVAYVREVLSPVPEALEWYSLWLEATNLLDDLIDDDKPINGSECDLFRITILLTTHPFFQRHQQALGVAVMTYLAMYQQSLVGDKDSELSTWLMAEASRALPVMVVMIARGYNEAAKFCQRMHLLLQEAFGEQFQAP